MMTVDTPRALDLDSPRPIEVPAKYKRPNLLTGLNRSHAKLKDNVPLAERYTRTDLDPLARAIWKLSQYPRPKLKEHLLALSDDDFRALNHGHRIMKPTLLNLYRDIRKERGL
jgi:hypothetical protein